jgi:hypothetical protein
MHLLLHGYCLWDRVLIVLLAIVSGELVLVLQERVLVVMALLAKLMNS